jgi:hypothetical protein
MTASSPGKGVVTFPPRPPSGFLPLERALKVMKFLNMVHSLSLCFTGTHGPDRLLREVLLQLRRELGVWLWYDSLYWDRRNGQRVRVPSDGDVVVMGTVGSPCWILKRWRSQSFPLR